MREAVFFYDHFYPDFTAGGPVTSLVNLAQSLKGHPIRIITSAFAFQPKARLSEIQADCWTRWHHAEVWYASSMARISSAMKTIKNENAVFYLNGMFSITFFLLPLVFAKRHRQQVVICPRGMLQAGALSNGSFKKKIYLHFLRASGLLRGVRWHATDTQESVDIRRWFGQGQVIDVILNLPKATPPLARSIEKRPGVLNLVYYSLITKKKNLLFLLQLLEDAQLRNVRLDIIGPVKDAVYWAACQNHIRESGLAGQVSFLGEKSPEEGIAAIANYHGLVLPTHGENFGHAIVEMLSCGRPVLISDKTPWVDVSENQAGYSLPLEKERWKKAIEHMLDWDQPQFDFTCKAAAGYYRMKFERAQLVEKYESLFGDY